MDVVWLYEVGCVDRQRTLFPTIRTIKSHDHGYACRYDTYMDEMRLVAHGALSYNARLAAKALRD
jgi:hypothetical protein